jgi:hypothetical protein
VWFGVLGSLILLLIAYVYRSGPSADVPYIPLAFSGFFFLAAFASYRTAVLANDWENAAKEGRRLICARCDGITLTIIQGRLKYAFPVENIKSLHVSFPILYIRAKGFRLDQKHRMSWFEPEDLHRLIDYVNSVQQGTSLKATPEQTQ